MKVLPFFILLISIASCASKKDPDKKTQLRIADSITPIFDTALVARPVYNPGLDSANSKHQRDSFYAIRPAYLFISTGNKAGFDKLIASAIDTSAVVSSKFNFISTEKYTYDKDSMPVSRTITYSTKNYKIKIIDKDLSDFQLRRIFINGKPLQWGSDIDLSLAGSNIIYAIELSPEDFRIIKFREKEFLYLEGYMEKCNGKGCRVTYHLLYDPELNKAVALEQYMATGFYMGKFNSNNQLGFLVFDDYDYNDLYQNFTVAAKAYTFSGNGKVVPARNAKGKQYYFDGYSIDDPDSICILKANFPFR